MSLLKKAIACALATMIGLCGVCAPGVAWAEEGPEVPEWAVDDGEEQDGVVAQATLPSTYDMRSDGLVTPVKYQNPWGSCWAFGGIAAAESSILSAYGSTYDSSKLDLSERHLAYFALQPVSEAVDPNQVGEGLHTSAKLNESLGDNAAFNAGGQPAFITTLFSQGIGPMLESVYPYRGNNGITSMDDFNQDPQKATKELLATELGSAEAVEDFIKAKAESSNTTYDQVLAGYIAMVKTIYETSPTYTKNDDWSIPETNADGSPNRLVSNGMVLRNGNVLPTYWVDGALNQRSMDAIKQEILNGRAVSICYYADQSSTYTKTPTEESKDHAQYAYDKILPNHSVCIVGWDDSYSRGIFAHEATTTGQDGEPIDRTEETTPPGDGAWIVKNSYGSETEWTTDDLGNTINKNKWGNLNKEGKATGYFYLSYYDKTIQQIESMEFDASLGTDGAFAVLQHDYMPAQYGFYETPATEGSSNVTSSANVFEASDQAIALKCVSTRTSEANARVTLAIYELNDGAKDPTDGKRLYRTSRNFEYGGFHRLDIDQTVTIAAGKRFSIVSTMSTVSPNGVRCYSAAANQGVSEKGIEKLTNGKGGKFYTSAVVNPGESYLYMDGKWQDWSSYTDALPADPNALGEGKCIDYLPIDNFSIKAYGVPVEEPEPEPADSLELSGSSHVQTYGNLPAKASGKGVLVGTTGKSKRLEQFTVSLPKDVEGSIEYRGHIQGKGWVGWSKDGAPCGTTGEARRMEAVQIQLSGKLADTHSVWYRMHSQAWGWLGWACDGQAAGTSGQAKRGEAVEVQVLPKGQVPEGYVEGQASYVGAATADVHLQGTGWTGAKSALEFGTTGQARRLEAIRLSVPNQPVAAGVSYEAHVQGKGWMPAATDGALAGISGKAKRLEAVRVSLTGDAAKKGNYSVWYRVHSQTYGWLGWAHDGQEAGTTGLAKRVEAIDVQVLPQGQVPRGYDASKAACISS